MIILALVAALAAQSTPAGCPPGQPGALCRAVAASQRGEPEIAAAEFEAAAQNLQGAERDRALAAAGNMWIAANQPAKAASALDRALAGTGLQAEQRGEALLDRARAAEAQNDLNTARAKVKEAEATISADPFLWYFSAALAIREGDAALAKTSIDRALALAPNDPTVLFEAGHVAHFGGNLAAARAYWTRASQLDPAGRSGAAAREALTLLEKPAAVESAAPATK